MKIFTINIVAEEMSTDDMLANTRDLFRRRGFRVGDIEIEHEQPNDLFGYIGLDGIGINGIEHEVVERASQENWDRLCVEDRGIKVYILGIDDRADETQYYFP